MTIKAKDAIKIYKKHQGSHSAIARELGCSREYIRQLLTPLGYPATRVHTLVRQTHIDFFDRYGMHPMPEVQAMTMKSYAFMRSVEITVGKQFPRVNKKAKKWSTLELLDIYKQAKYNYTAMAKIMGIRPSSVVTILRRYGLQEQMPSHYRSRKG